MANDTLIERNISIPQIDIANINMDTHPDLYLIELKDGSSRMVFSTTLIIFEDGNVNFSEI